MNKPVILTGIRSNEEPTLANYLGAFVPMVELQQQHAGEYQINMFVPDLHSFTTPIDHTMLYENTLHNLKYFVASGLDLNNSDTYIYRQSYVPAHSELTWILDCFTYIGEMRRMTQFKEKSGYSQRTYIEPFEDINSLKETPEKLNRILEEVKKMASNQKSEDSVTVGLFNYPVLMAADILLYGATYVPVGEDQFQHLEITRDIATRFNNKFGDVFIIPKDTKAQMAFIKRDTGLRIRSLTDPLKKMSKSSTDEKSKILLNDSPEAATKKIMNSTTDSLASVRFDWGNQPGITNLLQILALLTNRSQADVNAEWEGKERYGDFKKAVADAVVGFLTVFQAKCNAVTDEQLLAKLAQSEHDLTPIAGATLLRAQQAVGLRPKAS